MSFMNLIVERFGKDLSPGRMFESVVLLSIIWSKLKPHLAKIQDRLLGLETSVTALNKSFESQNASESARFEKIEGRISSIEKTIFGKDSK